MEGINWLDLFNAMDRFLVAIIEQNVVLVYVTLFLIFLSETGLVFMAFLPRIKQSCDAVVNITTGGGHGMTLDERLAAPRRASPEMTSLNMGSMNFGLYPMLERYKEFQHPWERTHLENSRDWE